jgi:fatty-acyl-CoA synthase
MQAEIAGGKLTQSYVRGADDIPLSDETIGNCFDRIAARHPEHEALVVRHQNIRWTYADLKERVNALAAGLLALGLEPGERIGMWAPNYAEWTITQFAAAKAGLVLVSINPAYRLSEVDHALNKAGCKALVTASAFKTSDYLGMLRELAPELATAEPGSLNAERLPQLRLVIQFSGGTEPGMFRFDDVIVEGRKGANSRLPQVADTLPADAPATILFTSGTTGLPKGATLSHHNILNNARITGLGMGITAKDRVCIPVPLYHTFGMVIGNLISVAAGATMVYPGPVFDPLAVLETVEAERCTTLYGVPTMFIAEVEHPHFASFDLRSLRTGMMGGAPCPIEVMKRVVDEMHMSEITITYGMTETSPCSTQTAPDDPLERRVATVGRVQPHVEIKIIDADGQIVEPGQTGEFCARGYNVMLGYWDDDEATAAVIDADGWMHSGDLVTVDAHGYFNVVGRIKDMVIRGGENLYPREIEEFLHQHPMIADVHVIGVPDEKYGEELCAWIRLRDEATATPEEIKAFCEGQIAHRKIPRYIKFVEEFPMTANGKVQKFVMRKQSAAEFGLVERKTA